MDLQQHDVVDQLRGDQEADFGCLGLPLFVQIGRDQGEGCSCCERGFHGLSDRAGLAVHCITTATGTTRVRALQGIAPKITLDFFGRCSDESTRFLGSDEDSSIWVNNENRKVEGVEESPKGMVFVGQSDHAGWTDAM